MKKDNRTHEIYVNTAKSGTTVTEAQQFTEVLPITAEVANPYDHTTVHGNILGLTKLASYLSYRKCSKKVEVTASIIAECQNCNMKQNITTCLKHWYAHVLFQYNTVKVTLTLF